MRRREMGGVVRAEMFGQLTSGLEAAWNKLKGEEVLTKENIAEPMREIRRVLLEADVSLPVTRRFVQAVSEQAVGVGVIKGVRPDQQLVKIVNDELVKLMGGEVSKLVFAKSGPTVILLAVCAKLAFYLKKQGKTSILVAADVYRPAAIDQLVILGEQVGVPVYAAETDVKPSEIARQGLQEAKKKNADVVIVDTAGRLQIDKVMMDELKEVKRAVNPTEALLVVDAMTGQEAAEEREKPELLAESPEKRKRVVKESGKAEQQVNQVVAQLFQMRARMKNLMGVMEGGSLPSLSNLQEALKAEEKAPAVTARRTRKSESRRQFADSGSARPSPRGFGSKN